MAIHSSLIDRFSSVRVLVVGDTILDRFQYGAVARMSPEAPVPVFCPDHACEMPGGAGNTAVNLAALGCRVRLLTRTGTDADSRRLLQLLAQSKVATFSVHQTHVKTSVKTRIVAGNGQLIRIDDEDVCVLEEHLEEKIINEFQVSIKKNDVVVLSDYGKGFLTEKMTSRFVSMCKKYGKTLIVDPKGVNYRKYRGVTIIKPNLSEISAVTGVRFDPLQKDFIESLTREAKKAIAHLGIGGMLITLGEYGMLYVPSGRSMRGGVRLLARVREVFDVSGAGDTTIAALAAALGVGASMRDAMEIANVAAGIAVGKSGTATVTASELKAEIVGKEDDVGRKILPLRELVRQVAQHKRSGKRIGFTNGCFDCCHLGHLSSLMQAKRLCEILVVGVNSDKWIKKNKGPDRPIQDEMTRTTLLASLEYVDYVVVFESRTALPIVEAIRPDIIAKEGYELENWPEGRFVKSIGGEAVVLKRVEGYSTSSLAARMGGRG